MGLMVNGTWLTELYKPELIDKKLTEQEQEILFHEKNKTFFFFCNVS